MIAIEIVLGIILLGFAIYQITHFIEDRSQKSNLIGNFFYSFFHQF